MRCDGIFGSMCKDTVIFSDIYCGRESAVKSSPLEGVGKRFTHNCFRTKSITFRRHRRQKTSVVPL